VDAVCSIGRDLAGCVRVVLKVPGRFKSLVQGNTRAPDVIILTATNQLWIDVTVRNAMSPTYVRKAANKPMHAAHLGAQQKRSAYAPIIAEYQNSDVGKSSLPVKFLPIVFEVHGGFHKDVHRLLTILEAEARVNSMPYIRDYTFHPRSMALLTMALVEGNAKAVISTTSLMGMGNYSMAQRISDYKATGIRHGVVRNPHDSSMAMSQRQSGGRRLVRTPVRDGPAQPARARPTRPPMAILTRRPASLNMRMLSASDINVEDSSISSDSSSSNRTVAVDYESMPPRTVRTASGRVLTINSHSDNTQQRTVATVHGSVHSFGESSSSQGVSHTMRTSSGSFITIGSHTVVV
jgi:hypothetical protein